MVLRSWLLVVALVAVSACGANSPTSPDTDWIELNSISPPSGTVLTAGESITFTATVTCTTVNSDGGTVALLLLDQGNRSLQTVQPHVTLARGDQTVTLSDTITVPVSGSTVTVTMPLFVNGSNSTRALKRVSYTVR